MIRLMKNSIIRINSDKEAKKQEVDSVLPFLDEVIQIDDDFTLGDFFEMIACEEELFDIIFCSQLGGFPIKIYLDDVSKDPTGRDNGPVIDYIEIQWVAEQWEFNGVNEIEIYTDCHGWGDVEDYAGTGKTEKSGIAFEFSPLADLKHLPLRLNEDFVMYKKNKFGPGEKRKEVIIEGKKVFSVYEIIGSLLEEISFMGTPENRDEALQDILDTKEEIEEALETGELGNVFDEVEDKTEPSDDIKKRLGWNEKD